MGAIWGEEKRKFGLHKTKNNDFFYPKNTVRKFREKRRAKREKNSPHSDKLLIYGVKNQLEKIKDRR